MKINKFIWTRIKIIITAKIVQWRRFKKKYLGKYTYVCVYLFIIDENVDIKFSAHDVFPVQASSGTFVLSKPTDFRSKKKKKKKNCTLMKFGFPIKIICLICER